MQYFSGNLPTNPIIGLTRNPIDRVGLSSFLPNYHIASMFDGPTTEMLSRDGVNTTTIHAAPDTNSMAKLMQTDDFKQLVQSIQSDQEPTYLLLTNITERIETLTQELGISIIANPASTRIQFENKASIREHHGSQLPFAPFTIISKRELFSDTNPLSDKLFPYVIQDESPSFAGGRGTFIVKTHDDLVAAIEFLKTRGGERVVVSQFINGENASIQGCVTHQGIFHGPLQTQLYDDPALVHQGEGSSKFAGGVWGSHQYSQSVQEKAYSVVKNVGEILRTSGYKGIFGVDLIVTPDEEVFMLEANARTTGLTQPLTLMQEYHDIPPLLLLHILEHMNVPYEITEPTQYQAALLTEIPFTFALLHNRTNHEVRLTKPLLPGVYKKEGSEYSFIEPGYLISHLPDDLTYFILPDIPQSTLPIPSRKSLVHLLVRESILTNGKVNDTWQSVIEWVESHFS